MNKKRADWGILRKMNSKNVHSYNDESFTRFLDHYSTEKNKRGKIEKSGLRKLKLYYVV